MVRTSKKKGSGSKIKKYKKARDTKRRGKDYDEICDLVAARDEGRAAPIPYDDDLPGGGQFFCEETGKHFCDQRALDDHKKPRAARLPRRASRESRLVPKRRLPRGAPRQGWRPRRASRQPAHLVPRRSRAYKRRVKELKEIAPYTQRDAELAAGMTVEVLPSAREARAKAAAAAESRMDLNN